MFAFDRDRFFSDWAARSSLPLNVTRQRAVSFLLDKLEQDTDFTMVRELAYVLATIRWETAGTFKPIVEKRCNRVTQPRLWEAQTQYWQTGFYGRGYVQLTWERNYRNAGTKLAGAEFTIDDEHVVIEEESLVANPDWVLEPEVSYSICSRGMREGWFTGRRLGQYIVDSEPPDYEGARRIINGVDHAADIAGIANEFELLLRASQET